MSIFETFQTFIDFVDSLATTPCSTCRLCSFCFRLRRRRCRRRSRWLLRRRRRRHRNGGWALFGHLSLFMLRQLQIDHSNGKWTFMLNKRAFQLVCKHVSYRSGSSGPHAFAFSCFFPPSCVSVPCLQHHFSGPPTGIWASSTPAEVFPRKRLQPKKLRQGSQNQPWLKPTEDV